MLLAVDIGNTHSVLGLIEGREVRHHWRLSTDTRRTSDEIGLQLDQLFRMGGIERGEISGAVVSTVVPPLREAWLAALESALSVEPLLVTAQMPLPLGLAVDFPNQVGTDRIANAVGGRNRFGSPMLVVDCGTTTNIDVVNAAGDYCGGVIMSGPEFWAEALFQRTSALPRVAMRRPDRVIGTNTVACIHSGLFHGFLGAVDRLVDGVRAELGAPDCPAVTTGGLGALVAQESARLSAHLPWLTLEGLASIWEYGLSR
ncbi:type III pantothenate kinase [Candidatus Sumerlaeota bacterium]|nr:type III pantothenate kinase [Candidatus Sumerlaeota bacterium]